VALFKVAIICPIPCWLLLGPLGRWEDPLEDPGTESFEGMLNGPGGCVPLETLLLDMPGSLPSTPTPGNRPC
jgi:hypothetical protein